MSIGGGIATATAADTEGTSWTASAPAAGDYYLLNVGSGKFLSYGASWGTQATLDEVGIKVTLAISNGAYTITGINSKYVGSGGFADQDAAEWTFTAVDGSTNTYTMTTGGSTYLYWDGSSVNLSVGTTGDATNANYQWQLITPDNRDAAIANATEDNPVDVTYKYIQNPNFAYNWNQYWTTENPWQGDAPSLNGTNHNGTYSDKNGEWFNKTFDSYLELSGLTEGYYGFKAQGFYRDGDYAVAAPLHTAGTEVLNAIYYAGDVEGKLMSIFEGAGKATSGETTNGITGTFPNTQAQAADYFKVGAYQNAPVIAHVTDGTLKIGFKKTASVSNDWTIIDDVRLLYYGTSYTDLTSYQTALQTAVTEAEALSGTIPTAAYTALTTVVTNNNKTYTDADSYTTATKAITDATAQYKALQDGYANYKTMKTNIQSLENTEGYTDNRGAKSTLDEAIEAQDKAIEEATTSDAVTTATTTLRTAGLTFVGAVTPSTSNPLDLTFLITNASFANNNATGWTYQSLPNFQSYGNAEYYQSNFDINQTLTGMPKGNYELKVKAFQRAGWAGSEGNVNAYIYINDYSALIKAAKDEAQATSLGGDEKQSGGGYIPNNMQTAGTYFDKGLYENSVLTSVDGTLKFGFKCENGTSGGYWTIFDDFRLYYYGNAVAVTLTEDGDFSAANDMDNATVTLTRTFNANAWNTLVLPFDLTATQVTDIFGSSAEIATYTGTTAGTDGSYTLNFTEGATTISANVPVLIYGANNVTAKEITGLTIKTGTPTSTPTDAAFAFTGSYNKSTTLTAGDFFISSDNKFYKANGKESMKGLRAVFRAVTTESATAKSLKLNIGGTATGINSVAAQSVDDGAVYNVAGQRVSNSYKGLVIKNGKKYLRK